MTVAPVFECKQCYRRYVGVIKECAWCCSSCLEDIGLSQRPFDPAQYWRDNIAHPERYGKLNVLATYLVHKYKAKQQRKVLRDNEPKQPF